MTITYHSSEILGRVSSFFISFFLSYIVLFFYLDLYTPTFTFTLQLLHLSYLSNYLFAAIWAFCFTFPLALYHFYSFISPALYQHEHLHFKFSCLIYLSYLILFTYFHIYLLQPNLFIDVLWEEMEGSFLLPQFDDFVSFTFAIQSYFVLICFLPIIIFNIKITLWIRIKPWVYLFVGLFITGFPFYTLEPEWWITMMIILIIEIPSIMNLKRL